MTEPERIVALDTVRGVAVLGILAMNIVSFAMPEAAYMNPRAWGGWHGADLASWAVALLVFDGKMRGLFSFLFGASMLLVIERAEAAGESAARVHYARMAWLFAFGLAHLVLVWDGDILNLYALVGMLVFAARRLPVERLLGLGLVLLVIQTLLYASLALDVVRVTAAAAHDPELASQARGYIADFGVPPAATLDASVALHRGAWAGLVADRFAHSWRSVSTTFTFLGLETAGYMILGMAAFRSGLLTGDWPRARYRQVALLGIGIGLAGYALDGWLQASHGFSASAVAVGQLVVAAPFRPAMVIGFAALVLLLMRPGGWLTDRVAAAGRMAFTNYLLTSVICTTIFYGYGLDLFGRLSRAELWPVVLALWLAMLGWSQPWLAHFRYGPFEWAWRSLARGRLQPFRR